MKEKFVVINYDCSYHNFVSQKTWIKIAIKLNYLKSLGAIWVNEIAYFSFEKYNYVFFPGTTCFIIKRSSFLFVFVRYFETTAETPFCRKSNPPPPPPQREFLTNNLNNRNE